MAMNLLFSSNDWHVEEAPVISWGFNDNGTFVLVIQRYKADGTPFNWNMNVPEIKLGELPNILASLDDEQRELLRFTGGWQANNAEVNIGLAL